MDAFGLVEFDQAAFFKVWRQMDDGILPGTVPANAYTRNHQRQQADNALAYLSRTFRFSLSLR